MWAYTAAVLWRKSAIAATVGPRSPHPRTDSICSEAAMELTPEERRRIYEEERTRIEARQQLEKKKAGRIGCFGMIGVLLVFIFVVAVIGSLSGTKSQQVTPNEPTASNGDSTRHWTSYSNVSRMDDGIMVGYSVTSEPTSWFKGDGVLSLPKMPTLNFQCRDGHTEAYIDLAVRAYVDRPVRIRFDSGPARSEWWNRSSDHTALFARRPIALAKQVAKAKRMLVEITPSGQNPVVLEFDVSGFDAKVGTLADACGWNRP